MNATSKPSILLNCLLKDLLQHLQCTVWAFRFKKAERVSWCHCKWGGGAFPPFRYCS